MPIEPAQLASSLGAPGAVDVERGLVASLLAATVTAQVKDELADQLQAALTHQSLVEVAHSVVGGLPLPSAPARPRQDAAARGRIIDVEAERRRADQEP